MPKFKCYYFVITLLGENYEFLKTVKVYARPKKAPYLIRAKAGLYGFLRSKGYDFQSLVVAHEEELSAFDYVTRRAKEGADIETFLGARMFGNPFFGSGI